MDDPDFDARMKEIAYTVAAQLGAQLGELVQAAIHALHAATEYLDAKRAQIAPEVDDDDEPSGQPS